MSNILYNKTPSSEVFGRLKYLCLIISLMISREALFFPNAFFLIVHSFLATLISASETLNFQSFAPEQDREIINDKTSQAILITGLNN